MYCNIFSAVFPSDEYGNREVWRAYFTHASRTNRDCHNYQIHERGKPCLRLGRCLRVDGRIWSVVQWLKDSRDCWGVLPEDDSDRLLLQRQAMRSTCTWCWLRICHCEAVGRAKRSQLNIDVEHTAGTQRALIGE